VNYGILYNNLYFNTIGFAFLRLPVVGYWKGLDRGRILVTIIYIKKIGLELYFIILEL